MFGGGNGGWGNGMNGMFGGGNGMQQKGKGGGGF